MKAKFLTDKEIESIFSFLDSTGKLIFSVALSTGLRIGDIVKIRKADIKPLAPFGCAISYTAEKTDKKGIAVINDKELSEKLLRAPRGRRGYIFPSNRSRSGHITRQTAYNYIKSACRSAGINADGISPHSFRKNFAVKLYHEKGLQKAQEALQHSNEAVTAIYAYADIYTQNDPDAPIRWAQINELVELVCEQLEMRGVL